MHDTRIEIGSAARLLISLLCSSPLVACDLLAGDGDSNDLPDLPSACTIEPAAVTVAPQTVVQFSGDCGAGFHVEGDAGGRTWSPDGYRHAFEYTAPELPGEYAIVISADRDSSVRGTAVVTVEATTYDIGTDLVWGWGLDNLRVRVSGDNIVAVESEDGHLRFLDETLSMIESHDAWFGRYRGDFRWSVLDPSLLYLVGGFHNLSGVSSEPLVRYDWRAHEVLRQYGIPERGTQQAWTLALSRDESMAGVWNDQQVYVRELEGERVLAHVAFDRMRNKWILTGAAYPEPMEVVVAFDPAVAFSVDNTWVLLGGSLVMDVATGLIIDEPAPFDAEELYDSGIGNVSPDRTRQYSFGPYNEALRAFEATMTDTSSGEVLWRSWHVDNPNASFFPDGQRMLALNFGRADDLDARNYGMAVIDVETGAVIAERTTGPRYIELGDFVAWSPDGERILARYSSGRPTMFMFTANGDPVWDSLASDLGLIVFVGDHLAGIRRNPASRDIEALEYLDRDTLVPTGELVLDFQHRESRFLDDLFYVSPDQTRIWISSSSMPEGGMAFDLETGAWRTEVTSVPEWARAQQPATTPLGSEPTEVCEGATPCVLHFVCGAFDPSGRWFVEGWNAGASDARSPILSFRIVDNTGTVRRSLETYGLDNCTRVAWHPTEMRIAVLDTGEIKVVDTSNPLGRER